MIMVGIFLFSNQNGETSGGMSKRVAEIVLKFFISDFDLLANDIKQSYLSTTQLVIRKLSHMSEYAILCLSFYFFISGYIKGKLKFILSPLLCFIYALTDEAHQLLIAGRNGSFIDVLIDTFGAIMMILLIFLISFICRRSKGSIKDAN